MLKNIISLSGYSAISQILVVAFLPVLITIYSPTEYGKYIFAISVSYLIASIFLVRLDFHVLGARSKKQLSLYFSFANFFYRITLSILVFVFILSIFLDINLMIEFSAILLASSAFSKNNFLLSALISFGRLQSLGIVKIVQSLILITLQYFIAIFKPDFIALISANIVSILIANYIFSNLLKYPHDFNSAKLCYFIILRRFSYYFKESLVGVLLVLKNHVVILSAAIAVVNPLYGIYGLFHKLIIVPTDLLARSISQLILSKGSLRALTKNDVFSIAILISIAQLASIGLFFVYKLLLIELIPSEWVLPSKLFAFLLILISPKLALDCVVASISRDFSTNVAALINIIFIAAISVTGFFLFVNPLDFVEDTKLVVFLSVLYCFYFTIGTIVWLVVFRKKRPSEGGVFLCLVVFELIKLLVLTNV